MTGVFLKRILDYDVERMIYISCKPICLARMKRECEDGRKISGIVHYSGIDGKYSNG